jgi:opacity protein-like surface antigen
MAGIGADMAITDNVFGRLEYMHTWLSKETYTYCTVCNADITLGQNSFRVALGYRF